MTSKKTPNSNFRCSDEYRIMVRSTYSLRKSLRHLSDKAQTLRSKKVCSKNLMLRVKIDKTIHAEEESHQDASLSEPEADSDETSGTEAMTSSGSEDEDELLRNWTEEHFRLRVSPMPRTWSEDSSKDGAWLRATNEGPAAFRQHRSCCFALSSVQERLSYSPFEPETPATSSCIFWTTAGRSQRACSWLMPTPYEPYDDAQEDASETWKCFLR